MNVTKKNLVRAFALFGCLTVTGVVVSGCGKKDEDDTTAAPAGKKGTKDATDKMDSKAGGDKTDSTTK